MYSYFGVIAFGLLFLTVTAFMKKDNWSTNCHADVDQSWHWVTLSIIDSFQALLIIILTLLFCKRSKPKPILDEIE